MKQDDPNKRRWRYHFGDYVVTAEVTDKGLILRLNFDVGWYKSNPIVNKEDQDTIVSACRDGTFANWQDGTLLSFFWHHPAVLQWMADTFTPNGNSVTLIGSN